MKNLLSLLLVTVLTTGCSTLVGYIPSFWDDNQSRSAIDIRQSVEDLRCTQPLAPQVQRVQASIQWFMLYSESKGQRQQDVIRLMGPLKETTDDFLRRVDQGVATTPAYCEIKRRIMLQQSSRAAQAVLGRF